MSLDDKPEEEGKRKKPVAIRDAEIDEDGDCLIVEFNQNTFTLRKKAVFPAEILFDLIETCGVIPDPEDAGEGLIGVAVVDEDLYFGDDDDEVVDDEPDDGPDEDVGLGVRPDDTQEESDGQKAELPEAPTGGLAGGE